MNIFKEHGPEIIRNEIIANTRNCLGTTETVGVYLSGGIDSAIILDTVVSLSRIYGTRVIIFAADFGLRNNECALQLKMADYYDVDIVLVRIDGIYDELPEIMSILPKPRFNIWPYFMANVAKMEGCSKIFVGEGADEIFGGYAEKSYLEAWADSIVYIQSTYNILHRHFGVEVCMPFMMLDWKKYLPLHENPNKRAMRIAYKNELPSFILEDVKSSPPIFTDYLALWDKEFKDNAIIWLEPETNEEAKELINIVVTRIWLDESMRRLTFGNTDGGDLGAE